MRRKLVHIVGDLDDTPVPAILADLYRIESEDMPPLEIGNVVVDTIERLAKRKQRQQ